MTERQTNALKLANAALLTACEETHPAFIQFFVDAAKELHEAFENDTAMVNGQARPVAEFVQRYEYQEASR